MNKSNFLLKINKTIHFWKVQNIRLLSIKHNVYNDTMNEYSFIIKYYRHFIYIKKEYIVTNNNDFK